jgi:hypothetical protein
MRHAETCVRAWRENDTTWYSQVVAPSAERNKPSSGAEPGTFRKPPQVSGQVGVSAYLGAGAGQLAWRIASLLE